MIDASLRALAVPIGSVQHDPSNARKHGERNLEAIKSSLAAFGQRKPIVVQRQGMIVRAGNGTLAAAKALGWKEIAAVIVDDDNATAVQFAIADNRTAELAEWDNETLVSLLDGMDQQTREMLAFDDREMASLMTSLVGEAQQDVVPDPPANPVTKRGDLIVLGRHRLLCGDSTSAADVGRLLGSAKPFLMVTDPPYGVNYDPEWRHRAGVNNSDRVGKVANDERADWTDAWRLSPCSVAYVWHAGRFASTVADSLVKAGFEIRAQIIWRKSRFAISRGHYHWQHEPCFYGSRAGDDLTEEQARVILEDARAALAGGFSAEHQPCWYGFRGKVGAKWVGDRKQSTVWDIEVTDDGQRTHHGTQKPVECMARPIRNHGGKEDDVYDPFLGSGTTLVAAEQMGRRCFGMELDPAYCDVIVQRWENLTGQKAERINAA